MKWDLLSLLCCLSTNMSQGYKKAGEYTSILDTIKWATDYFIKAVGDGTRLWPRLAMASRTMQCGAGLRMSRATCQCTL